MEISPATTVRTRHRRVLIGSGRRTDFQPIGGFLGSSPFKPQHAGAVVHHREQRIALLINPRGAFEFNAGEIAPDLARRSLSSANVTGSLSAPPD